MCLPFVCRIFCYIISNRSSFLGALLEAINRDFGSLQAMQDKLSAATVAVQGSGWGWLGYNKQSKSLQIATCANQVSLE